jgi:hypothetical protein
MSEENQTAAEEPRGAGVRRSIGKPFRMEPVPTEEGTEESGPRRLYVPPTSTKSMSTRESGPRRLYTSSHG